MAESYGVPPGTAINYGQLGFDPWVDELCRQWGLDSSTYPNHQTGDRPDIGAAPNPQRLNRGIDWTGPPEKMLAFAKWLVSIGPRRTPGQYGPGGLEMVIFQDPRTGERVWYPDFVDYGADFGGHTDHVHTRQSAALIEAPPPTVVTVPLVDNGDGTWTSPSRAWAHLIMRESGGNPTIIQQITDVNSGGNEAEGLFQITPRTWRAHHGEEFAPTARLATPQQQALVAARIFTANPSGSDWGAGLPGREDPGELAAGLVPLIQQEDDWMANPELERMIREIHGAWFNRNPSKSRYGDPTIVWGNNEYVRNIDGHVYDLIVEHNAALGDAEALGRVEAAAGKGDRIAAAFLTRLTTTAPTTAPPPPPPVTPPTVPSTPPQENTPPASAQTASTGSLSAAIDQFSQSLQQVKAGLNKLLG